MTTRGVGMEHSHSFSEINYGLASLIGIIAAAVMAVVEMPIGLLLGHSFFAVPRGIATLILTRTAAGTGLGIAAGLGLQLVFGVVFGVIFAILYTMVTREYSLTNAIVLGLAYGLLLYVISFFIIGPSLVPLMVSAVPTTLSLIGYLIFGGILGFYARWH